MTKRDEEFGMEALRRTFARELDEVGFELKEFGLDEDSGSLVIEMNFSDEGAVRAMWAAFAKEGAEVMTTRTFFGSGVPDTAERQRMIIPPDRLSNIGDYLSGVMSRYMQYLRYHEVSNPYRPLTNNRRSLRGRM